MIIERLDKFEIALAESLPDEGAQRIDILKARPEATFSKWNGEVAFSLRYLGLRGTATRRPQDRIEWTEGIETARAYMDSDNNFEFEIELSSRPPGNIFNFQMAGYDDLDFFVQPPLDQEPLAPDAVSATPTEQLSATGEVLVSRPINVVNSIAVYSKTRKHHRIGGTNYGPGKFTHIYRPKATDARQQETWCTLSVNLTTGILAVECPSLFLDNAVYPVIIDPTFGHGGTTPGTLFVLGNKVYGTIYNLSEDADVSKLTCYFVVTNTAHNAVGGIYSGLNLVTGGQSTETSIPPISGVWSDLTCTPSLSSGDHMLLMTMAIGNGTEKSGKDSSSNDAAYYSRTYDGNVPDPRSAADTTGSLGIYATYTASGGTQGFAHSQAVIVG